VESDRHVFEAVLVREPGNKYDPNAIGVYSSVGQVGHLARESAVEYGGVFEEIARQGAAAGVCEGLISRRTPQSHTTLFFGSRFHESASTNY
jgi:hypothetical protein